MEMDNRHFNLSWMKDFIVALQEMVLPSIEAAKRIQESLLPVVEVANDIIQHAQVIGEAIVKALRPVEAVERLGNAQFVIWEYTSDDFVEAIIASDSVNDTLSYFLRNDNFKQVEGTIEKTTNHPAMKKMIRLYTQSAKAFHNGDYDLAVNGFTSIFDGLLTELSANSTHKLPPRIKAIKEKFEKEEVLFSDDFALLALALTLEKTLDSFSAVKDFKEEEPELLNRHWIAHGRSHRQKTNLDCVKMVNLIWGLLLIQELDEKQGDSPFRLAGE